jgi:tetratricopeptide (TPR) repeat protein
MVLAARTDSSADALVLTGQAEVQLGSRQGVASRVRAVRHAKAAFSSAFSRDSTRADVLENLAWIGRLLPSIFGGSRSEATAMLQRLERHHPYRGALLRGHFERSDGRSAAADSIYRHLVTTQPDSAPAWFARYDLSYRLGKSDVARDALRRYIALVPSDRTTLFHRGQLAAVLGVELAEGEVALLAYLKGPTYVTQPAEEVAWWRLGQVLEKQGKTVRARDAYRKAIALYPRDADFRTSLRSLEASASAR